MIKRTIRQPHCRDCKHYHINMGSRSTIVKGRYIPVGTRYCTGGKRMRIFKQRDPQVKVPGWCPRREQPKILRVYTYKSNHTAYLAHELGRRMGREVVLESDYALRYEGRTNLSAREFQQHAEAAFVSDILGFAVHTHEVVEIDDGLQPYFFFLNDALLPECIYFDGEHARKNGWVETDSGDSPDSEEE